MDEKHTQSIHLPVMHEDEITLSLIATGVIRTYERVSSGRRLTYPYPDALQRELNRLVATRLKRGQQPPQGIPDLLHWCQQPIGLWQLELPPDSVGEEDVLLSGQIPTSFCDSWACASPDAEADLTETQFMSSVFEVCRATAGETAYAAFRQLLIEHRVLTALEFQQALVDPELFYLDAQLRAAFLPAPPTFEFGEEYWCCARCGNLLQPDSADNPICENDRCRFEGSPVGRKFNAREEAHWLNRGLRRYIADPGIAEVRLAHKLEKIGVQVIMWPAFDSYDLQIIFPTGESWAVDVKDWANPFLLARQVKPFALQPEWSRAYFVFPDERLNQRGDYVRAFRQHCPILNSRVHGIAETQFVKEVKHHLENIHA
jgi:REase associating with pPIWI_RE/pPIWI_RE three-gene island domain Y